MEKRIKKNQTTGGISDDRDSRSVVLSNRIMRKQIHLYGGKTTGDYQHGGSIKITTVINLILI